jgi:spore coat protein CotF
MLSQGINQNYIVYELMTETAWYSSAIDYAQWTQQFIARRYGITTDRYRIL